MSRINIPGIIENIKSRSSVYTPIIEAIVNSIDAIVDSKRTDGEIEIILFRERKLEFGDLIPNVVSIHIKDNGVGFTHTNRESFDTYYSEQKKLLGGKGFGRFMYVKYFGQVKVESVYKSEDQQFRLRKFDFGKEFEIIVNETDEIVDSEKTYTKVFLSNLKPGNPFDRNIEVIARKLLEKLLIFFVNDNFKCPTIIIRENDNSSKIILNEALRVGSEIQKLCQTEFELYGSKEVPTKFNLKVFKLYFPSNQKSRISLTADNREVTECLLQEYVPEFEDEFYDEVERQNGNSGRKNYVIRSYVTSLYLDKNVSHEREEFNFSKKNRELVYEFNQTDIEKRAAEETKKIFNDEVGLRSDKKRKRFKDYVNSSAPWHKQYFNDLDLSDIAYNLKDEDIEIELQKVKFNKEVSARRDLRQILSSSNGQKESYEQKAEKIHELISKISEIQKSDLVHYVCSRKLVLEAFEGLRRRNESDKSSLEKEIHNLIFPMGKDSEDIEYENHNLWLLDERLVFSEFIASDKKINKTDALGEPDLIIFDKKRSFRSGDNEFSNPLTIFEFKRPKRESYTAADDPITQMGDYLEKIREGKYEMPEGVEKIKVNDNTPVYGYVICDITDKIHHFCDKIHQLTISPDKEGYFGFQRGYGMYVEVISYKKLFSDALLRNKIFFKKEGYKNFV